MTSISGAGGNFYQSPMQQHPPKFSQRTPKPPFSEKERLQNVEKSWGKSLTRMTKTPGEYSTREITLTRQGLERAKQEREDAGHSTPSSRSASRSSTDRQLDTNA